MKSGLNSFREPAGQIFIMYSELVEQKKQVSGERFFNA